MKKNIKLMVLLALVSTIYSGICLGYAEDRKGRLGVGYSNQLKTDVPSLSLKMLRSKTFGIQALFGMNTSDNGGYGLGVKMFNLIYDEPQLNFYTGFLAGMLNDRQHGTDNTGFQFDATLGSEFSFTGLESIGFSFEFGISINKVDEVSIETTASNMLVAGVHFYL